MVTKSRLRLAIAAEKGVDFKKLKQQKKYKEALKRNSATSAGGFSQTRNDDDEEDEDEDDVDMESENDEIEQVCFFKQGICWSFSTIRLTQFAAESRGCRRDGHIRFRNRDGRESC
jgi:hypothetical protein